MQLSVGRCDGCYGGEAAIFWNYLKRWMEKKSRSRAIRVYMFGIVMGACQMVADVLLPHKSQKF